MNDQFSSKVNKILNFLLVLFLIITFRSWHLTIIQKDFRLSDAINPQRKTILEKPNRGVIFDRYGIPLALNRIKYDAAIYYSHIKQIPIYSWETSDNGQKIKYFKRKEYIKNLSKILSSELNMDAERIESLIHAKATLLPHIPFVIKENISEKEYFKLKNLQKDYLGLSAEISSERFYPNKKLASNILGFMGSINSSEYLKTAKEIKNLQNILFSYKNKEDPPLPNGFNSFKEMENYLSYLKKKAYNLNDLIGKMGIEAKFEKELRGFHGKKTYAIDINGNFLKLVTNKEKPKAGNSYNLSISAELQQFAEELLIKDEMQRIGNSKQWDTKTQKSKTLKQPWIKGGAIVAIQPESGEVIALASYPRFDPNDFIPSSNITIKKDRQKNILKWLETPSYIGCIWDNKLSFHKEIYEDKHLKDTDLYLSWNLFLELILPIDSKAKKIIDNIKNIGNAITLQEDVETLLYYSNQNNAEILFDVIFNEKDGHKLIKSNNTTNQKAAITKALKDHFDEVYPIKTRITKFLKEIPYNLDKLMVVDLCKIAIHSPSFSDNLIKEIKNYTLNNYWTFSKAFLQVEQEIKQTMQDIFHLNDFKKWKEENLDKFLKEKREYEKEHKLYARPYLDYLDAKERELFLQFWNKHKFEFILTATTGKTYIYNDYPLEIEIYYDHLFKKHTTLIENKDFKIVKNAIANLDNQSAFEFLKTIRPFSMLDRPLYGNYARIRKTMKNNKLEKHLAASFYPLNGFGYARSQAFRQSTTLGSIFKLVTAYSALKQKYLFLLNNNQPTFALNPLTIIDDIRWDRRLSKKGNICYGYTLDNKPLPRYYRGGRLPKSSHPNIGKVDLTSALAKSSNPYFALLAGEIINNPDDLITAALDFGFGKKTGIELTGEIAGHLPKDVTFNKTGLYSLAIGQHSLIVTPLQTAVMLSSLVNGGYVLKPKITLNTPSPNINNTIFLPKDIRYMLLKGMNDAVWGDLGNARPEAIRRLYSDHLLKKEYKSLKNQIIGKTSTAEIMFNPDILPSASAKKYKDIWFGAVAFEEQNTTDLNTIWQKPELVVIVYLKYGDGGKEAAPIAAQIIKKYREIKTKYKN